MENKDFQCLLEGHSSACIKLVSLERVVLECLILETDDLEADLSVAKHSMNLTWD